MKHLRNKSVIFDDSLVASDWISVINDVCFLEKIAMNAQYIYIIIDVWSTS